MVDKELQNRFFDLANKYEKIKSELDSTRKELNETMETIGTGNYIQNPETLDVYKIEIPKGTFVEYRKIGYVRTAREGEVRGSLSKKEAQEAGFILKK